MTQNKGEKLINGNWARTDINVRIIKDIKIINIIIFQMFKKLSTGIEDIEKDLSQTSRDEN